MVYQREKLCLSFMFMRKHLHLYDYCLLIEKSMLKQRLFKFQVFLVLYWFVRKEAWILITSKRTWTKSLCYILQLPWKEVLGITRKIKTSPVILPVLTKVMYTLFYELIAFGCSFYSLFRLTLIIFLGFTSDLNCSLSGASFFYQPLGVVKSFQ